MNGLFDPRRGDEAASVERFAFAAGKSEVPLSNQFALYAVEAGAGTCEVNDASHPFAAGDVLCLAPYQHVAFCADEPAHGQVLRFHANFVCLEIFHAEVGCNSRLFADPYSGVAVGLAPEAWHEVRDAMGRVEHELAARATGYHEVAVACVKLVLVALTRAKLAECGPGGAADRVEPPTLQALREAIEANYTRLHAPADYARLLGVAPKSLGRLVRQHYQKSLTTLIRDRLMIHAKWEVLHTLRPIKEIAFELGFADEFYFSRLFKKATGMAPTQFRAFETEIRQGSNLSRP